ncbi:MAG TPA: bifunctional 3-(3-hydroxy-phenyl)propionate/3-hydroxycinnamic acid hydroxylase [Acidimicrobiales bacterium]|nr:bifunctional 3-(3-hydroxy-phenyl)propionate/3-hydroxycinnamic acid hydroxylase [Acidimicrobiales bacterium]
MTADVAIVGAGPVGLVLAVLLGRRGRRVEVLERRGEPWARPRAVHFDHEAARILQSAGVMDELAAATEPMDAYEWRNAAGEVLLRLDGGDGPALSGWPASLMFHQPELERLLEAAVAALPSVSLRRGWEVTAVEPGADSLTLRGEDGAVEARWVVGCDGAGSLVRSSMGVGVTDLGAGSDWLVVDVVPAAPAAWKPLNIQVCDPARPTTAVAGGPGRRRWEFLRLPGETLEELASPEMAWRLLEPWGATPATATIERLATYTFGARVVDRWDRGRLLVAGDAAHQMPPFAGQGLCSGIRDAANLAWKLDLVLGGVAPVALLETYGTERAPQVRTEIDFSIDLGDIICTLDPAEAAARDAGMVPAAAASGPVAPPPGPPLGPGVARPGDLNAGRLSLQAEVACAGRWGRFDDVAGGRWVLLGSDPAALALPEALSGWWSAELGGRVWYLAAGGRYRAWLEELGASTVLVRPDFYLFGTASGPDAGASLVGALADRVSPRRCPRP